MTIEEEVFQKSSFVFPKLTKFGFQKLKDDYQITKNISHNLQIVLMVSLSGTVKGKIYDLAFDAEYTNFRLKNTPGEFSTKIKQEYLNFLKEVKENCTITNYFLTEQANRLTFLIKEELQVAHEFPWQDENGIFRNPTSQKWFAIIMEVNKNKLLNKEEITNVINIKLDPIVIEKLLKEKGFYPAYHMNKKNWLSIILDDTLPDNVIINLIKDSYNLTNVRKKG